MEKRFVVVGSGYAGVLAAVRLARRAGPGAVTLVDPELQLVERVRLHEKLVTGRDVSHSVETLTQGLGITLVRGRVVALDDGQVRLEDGRALAFDRCIVATGSKMARTTPGAAEHAIALEPSTTLGARAALRVADRIVVMGAGLTGVEVASEIAETFPDKRVTLVSRALTPSLSSRARAHVESVLRDLGVELVIGAGVDRVDEHVLHVGARAIPFDLAIDTLGFASEAPAFLSGARDAQGRVLADAAMRARDHANVFLAGDLASPEGTLAGEPMIRGCQSAMPSGAHAADAAWASANGGHVTPFAFMPNGFCVSLGRREGVIDAYGMVLTGRLAAWIKEQVVRYTIASMHWQASGMDYRWRPFFGAPRKAVPQLTSTLA